MCGVVGQPFNEVCSASKFAVVGFMEALAPVAAAVSVDVSVIEPSLSSEFINNAGLDPAAMVVEAGQYAAVLDRYLARTFYQFNAAQSAAEVADMVAHLLTTDNPPPRTQTSDWVRDFVETNLKDTDAMSVLSMTSRRVV